MNKKITKCLCLAMGLTMSLSVFGGCNGGGNSGDAGVNGDDAKTIYVQMYEGGYGAEVYKAIAKDFEAAYADEGYSIVIAESPSLVYSSIESRLKAGPKINQTDLFLGGDVNIPYILSQGSSYVSGYELALEDLTDLYNSKVYGEETLFKDKLNADCVSQNQYNGKYYSTNWAGGATGFAYNVDFFTQNGWTVPNTTKELVALVQKIRAANYTPFVWCGTTASYWEYALMPWWRQLSTDEEVERFWNCEDEDGNLTADNFKSQARLQAYQILESLIYDTKNSHSKSMTLTHIEAQMHLYDKNNKIAMMPTGDWIENEMYINGYARETSNVGFMKIPVASEVLYQYDSQGNQTLRFPTVDSDEKLSKVIADIDAGKNSSEGVSAEDFAALKKIRSYNYTLSFTHNAMIPVYADAKVGAKKFLSYLASDEALQKYYDMTGAFLPYDISNVVLKNNATKYQQDLYSVMSNISFLSSTNYQSKFFYRTELSFSYGKAEAYIGTTAKEEQMTGKEYYDYVYYYYSSNFDTYVALAR